MGEFNSYLNSLNKRLNRQDRQYEAIQKAEEDYQKGIDGSLCGHICGENGYRISCGNCKHIIDEGECEEAHEDDPRF